jgi:hypothetical protein
MFARNPYLSLVALFATACASTPGPPGYLQPAESAQREAYGAWIDVRLRGDRTEVAGEFVAVGGDTVFVLTASGLRAIPRSSIEGARLGTYDSQWADLAYWVIGGTLMSASHGYYAAITAPLWIVIGSLTAGAVSRQPIEDVSGNNRSRWLEVSKFARFPQGMPRGIDRTTLRLPPRARSTPGRVRH